MSYNDASKSNENEDPPTPRASGNQRGQPPVREASSPSTNTNILEHMLSGARAQRSGMRRFYEYVRTSTKALTYVVVRFPYWLRLT